MVPTLHSIVVTALTVAVVFLGCGPTNSEFESTDTTDVHDTTTNLPDGDLGDASAIPPWPIESGFVGEHLDIGSDWYLYDPTTHAISPREELYFARWPHGSALVEILTYYDIRGTSGFFTLRVSTAEPGAQSWEPSRRIELAHNVKAAPVCVDLFAGAEVACAEPHDLVLRTDARVVPAAGFAVAEPALYFSGTHAGLDSSTEVARIVAGDELPGPDQTPSQTSLVESALRHPDSSVLTPAFGVGATRALIQATADMKLAQWMIHEVVVDSDTLTIDLSVRCVPLALTAVAQTPLSTAEVRRTQVAVARSDDGAVSLLDLCGTNERLEPFVFEGELEGAGRWPPSQTFDLFVDHRRAETRFHVAPGALIHMPASQLAEETLTDVSVPPALWE